MAGTKAISQHRGAPKHHQKMTPSLTQKPDDVQQPVSLAAHQQQQHQQHQQSRLLTNSSSPLVSVGQLVAGGASKQNQISSSRQQQQQQQQQHQCLQSSASTSHQLMAGVGPQSLRSIPSNEQMIRERLQKVQENKDRLIRLQEECFREVSSNIRQFSLSTLQLH